MEINYFHNAYTSDTPGGTVHVRAVLRGIQGGKWREKVLAVRAVTDHTQKTSLKKALPAVTFCGTFAPTRANENLVNHSGIVHLDYDHLPRPWEDKARLKDDPHIAYAFISPSGEGLKVGLKTGVVDSDLGYRQAWALAGAYLGTVHRMPDPDASGKDIARLCFVSFDPLAYYNGGAEEFSVLGETTPTHPPKRVLLPIPHDPSRWDRYRQIALDRAARLITQSVKGSRHRARLRAGYLLGGYAAGGFLTMDEAYAFLEPLVTINTAHLTGSLKTIRTALQKGSETPVTYEQLDAEYREWRGRNE